MVHSVSRWTRDVQVKLWDPLRTRAISELIQTTAVAVFTFQSCRLMKRLSDGLLVTNVSSVSYCISYCKCYLTYMHQGVNWQRFVNVYWFFLPFYSYVYYNYDRYHVHMCAICYTAKTDIFVPTTQILACLLNVLSRPWASDSCRLTSACQTSSTAKWLVTSDLHYADHVI